MGAVMGYQRNHRYELGMATGQVIGGNVAVGAALNVAKAQSTAQEQEKKTEVNASSQALEPPNPSSFAYHTSPKLKPSAAKPLNRCYRPRLCTGIPSQSYPPGARPRFNPSSRTFSNHIQRNR